MVLITLSSLSPLLEEELDYRLGALEKRYENVFLKMRFSKTLEWGSPAQVWFIKRQKFLKRRFAGGKWRKENIFENFSA
jgi:deoxyadenosine/deoxycytidine kinase